MIVFSSTIHVTIEFLLSFGEKISLKSKNLRNFWLQKGALWYHFRLATSIKLYYYDISESDTLYKDFMSLPLYLPNYILQLASYIALQQAFLFIQAAFSYSQSPVIQAVFHQINSCDFQDIQLVIRYLTVFCKQTMYSQLHGNNIKIQTFKLQGNKKYTILAMHGWILSQTPMFEQPMHYCMSCTASQLD